MLTLETPIKLQNYPTVADLEGEGEGERVLLMERREDKILK